MASKTTKITMPIDRKALASDLELDTGIEGLRPLVFGFLDTRGGRQGHRHAEHRTVAHQGMFPAHCLIRFPGRASADSSGAACEDGTTPIVYTP